MFSVPQIICPSCSATMPYTAAACPGCKRRMVGVGYPARSPGPRKPPDLGPTPFVECRAPGCHYFVTASDTVCPNCGADEPSRAGRRVRLGAFLKARDSQGLLFSLILLIFTAVLLVFYALDGGDRALPWVIVVGGFASAAAGWGLTRLLRRAFDLAGAGGGAAAAGSGALRHSETTIMQRLVEIRRRGQQVEAALARAHPEAVGRMAEAREALKGARQLLRRQHARYGMKLVEIEAARWQNGLAPLIHNIGELTFEQNENRLRALDAAVAEGARLRSKAEKHREALGDGGEVEEFARKVSETLESCARIREALAGRQAELALKGLTPLQDALQDAGELARAPSSALDVFNLQVSITDFSSSFDELEDEYRRSREEAEIGENIGRLLDGEPAEPSSAPGAGRQKQGG